MTNTIKNGIAACPLVSRVSYGSKANVGMRTGLGLGAVVATNKINRAYVTGAIVGAGITVLGYYLYKKNQKNVDDFLCGQQIDLKSTTYDKMNLKDLNDTKKHLEDLIAIKEVNNPMKSK